MLPARQEGGLTTIPLHWKSPVDIPDLHRIIDNYRRNGGAIVEYDHVFSVFLFTFYRPQIRWVPAGTNRFIYGLKHSLFCALFGWWSLTGIFWTIRALIKNSMGGIDVTRVFVPNADLLWGEIDPDALAELQRSRRAQALAFALVVFLLLAASIVFVALPPLRRAGYV